jgi:membrane protein
MGGKDSRFQRLVDETRALLEDRTIQNVGTLSRLQRFVHFWVLVGRSFVRNRCPVRASALAYVTLLSLIPLLAVVMSITSTFLKKEGEDRIDQFIVKMVASITPPAMLSTNVALIQTDRIEVPEARLETEPDGTETVTPLPTDDPEPSTITTEIATNELALPKFAQDPDAIRARREAARAINEFIQNARSGTLGVTGSIFLIFVAISLLSRVEDAFNDIWGVAHGRTWFTRIFLYWGVICFVPLLLIAALGMASGPHFEATHSFLITLPLVGQLAFQILPVVVLCLTFALIYMLMPNTRVDWRAALVGGLVGGGLFHVNNLLSVFYVARAGRDSMIYGSIALVPILMLGLYLAWIILLFGAQVAYAWQNRASYFEEKQVENINQRGKEFVALRLATLVGQHYLTGSPPPTASEMSQQLAVPTRLIQQIMRTLCAARLMVETAGPEVAYFPARPMETITCHDILNAIRATLGQELTTRDEPTRAEVFGEFERIQEAERRAAASVSMLTLAHRAQCHLEHSNSNHTESEPRHIHPLPPAKPNKNQNL